MSGSNKRQRPHRLTARFTAQEADLLAAKAAQAGISRSAFIRFAALDTPPPRSKRAPSLDEKLLVQALAQLGKIGSNVNQLAYYAHLGKFQTNSLDMALRDLADARLVLMQALGFERPLPDTAHQDGRAA